MPEERDVGPHWLDRYIEAPRMMPGSEPYSAKELEKLSGLLRDAADTDPGEGGEVEGRTSK